MDNEKKIPSRRLTWLSPSVTIKLLLIIAFLGLNAIGNLISAFSQFGTHNMYQVSIYLLTFILYLVPAYGLYRLKKWARLLQLTFSIMFVIQGMLVMLSGQMFIGMVNIVLYGLTAIYLLSEECRKLFLSTVPKFPDLE